MPLAVRPVNSRVPCYFEYKNFRGNREESALARGSEAKGRRGGGGERGRRAALKFYKGLPRQPERACNRVVYLHERAMPFRRLRRPSANANKYTRRARPITFSSPSLARLPSPLFLLFCFQFTPCAIVFTLSREILLSHSPAIRNHD